MKNKQHILFSPKEGYLGSYDLSKDGSWDFYMIKKVMSSKDLDSLYLFYTADFVASFLSVDWWKMFDFDLLTKHAKEYCIFDNSLNMSYKHWTVVRN